MSFSYLARNCFKIVNNINVVNFSKNIVGQHNPRLSFHNGLILYLRNQTPDQLAQIETRIITKDRSVQVPVETSIKYLQSSAYQQTYGDSPVWFQYRRNHKGAFPPRKTRRTCIRKGVISTGNPCPICRDEYLVLHEINVDLLKQFISPQTGAILSYQVTGLCQKQHQQLSICIQRAQDIGLITFDVPFRKYNYESYMKHKNN